MTETPATASLTVACPTIAGVILAAGASSRMGTPKALLSIGTGECFLSRLAAVYRGADVESVVVVVGPDAEPVRVRAAAVLPPIRIAVNPDPSRGQLSSLLVALDEVEPEKPDGLLVTLVDAPLVGAETVRRLLDAWAASRAPVVRPERHGRHGHPVIFDRAVFGELRRADPALGARAVVRAHAASVLDVTVEDEGAFIDIDTPEDYRRWVGR